MEKIFREKEVHEIKTVKKSVPIFVASDGSEFEGRDAEKRCKQYEAQVEYQKKIDAIERVVYENNLGNIPDEWFLPKNEEELEIVKNLICFHDKYNRIHINDVDGKKQRQLSANEWIGCVYEDGGDYRGDRYIYTLDYILLKIEKFKGIFPLDN